MPKADCVHSTPPISLSDSHQSTFLSVNTSRRALLTNAAALAAAGTALSLAAPIAPAEAATVTTAAISGPGINPRLIELKADIDDNLTAWFEIEAECKIRDRAVKTWEKRNPLPSLVWDDEARGYKNSAARSDWCARRADIMRKAQLGKIKGERNEVAAAYGQAVHEFAAVNATNQPELMFKVETAAMMDSSSGTIAQSVLFDIIRLQHPARTNAGDLEMVRAEQ